MAHKQPPSMGPHVDTLEIVRVVLERPSDSSDDSFAYVAEADEHGSRQVVARSPSFQPQVDLAAERTALAQLVRQLEQDGWVQEPHDPFAAIGVTLRRPRAGLAPQRDAPEAGPD